MNKGTKIVNLSIKTHLVEKEATGQLHRATKPFHEVYLLTPTTRTIQFNRS